MKAKNPREQIIRDVIDVLTKGEETPAGHPPLDAVAKTMLGAMEDETLDRNIREHGVRCPICTAVGQMVLQDVSQAIDHAAAFLPLGVVAHPVAILVGRVQN